MTPTQQKQESSSAGLTLPLRNKKREIIALAVVDPEDYERVSRYRWCLASTGRVVRTTTIDERNYTVYLHREVLGIEVSSTWVRFKNGDPLDCRKENLEVVKAVYGDRQQARGSKRRRLKSVYGLEDEDIQAILKRQGYACAICECNITERYDVDHCHETGDVRGFLCRGCNLGIRRFERDPKWLEKALAYIG